MNTENVFILTGAGLSAESGIHTYRDSNGLWSVYDQNIVSTPDGFNTHPEMVQDFYNMGRKKMSEVEPNAAHYALGQLREEYKGDLTVVTMNIDDLHERGGDSEVLHMHGNIFRSKCTTSTDCYDQHEDIVPGVTKCVCCGLIDTLRPDVVWFGELPYFMNTIYDRIDACDIFITIGTSGSVAPASEFVKFAWYDGKRIYNANLDHLLTDQGVYTEQFIGPASETVPQLVNDLMDGKL
jgi:NAD-dependent deacetylase